MPKRTYKNFAGGQNNYQGEYASPVIADEGGTEALFFNTSSTNWECAEDGLSKYHGFIQVLSSAIGSTPTITGLYEWKGIDIVCADTKVYTVSGASVTQIYSGVTADKFFDFTEWDDGTGTEILIMCNGADTPLEYDGTTCATVTITDDSSPIWDGATPKGAAVFRNNVFYWGDPTYPHRIYKARGGTHNNFDNTTNDVDAFDVDAGFGGKLTGLKPLTDDILVVYKERAIRRLSGSQPFGSSTDPFSIRPVTNEFGCIAPRTLVGSNVEHYFLSEDGIRQLRPIESYGDIEPLQPSYPIQDIINDLNFDNDTAISNACALFFKPDKQIWFSVPRGSNSTNNQILIYDVISKGIDPRSIDDINASCLAQIDRKIWHGDYGGQLYRHGDTFGLNGDTYTATWEGKWIAHNGVGAKKRYREIHIYCESEGAGDLVFQWQVLKNELDVSYSSTEEISPGTSLWDTMMWDTDVWGGGTQTKILKIKNLGRGKAIKFKFINSSTSQRIKIRQVDLFYDLFNTSR